MLGSAYQLEIQKFLNGFQSLSMAQKHLQMKFAIDIKTDYLVFQNGTTEQVWIYNYDMLNSNGDRKIENEARGLILNANNEIVSLSFQRFFNIHEHEASKIDWKSARLEQKLDGSLIVIYGYKGEVFVQTRKSVMASGSMIEATYLEAVTDVLQQKFPDDHFKPFREGLSERYAFVFEYTGPCNRIVTPYRNSDLILLTAFRRNLGGEVMPKYIDSFAKEYGFTRPATYDGINSEQDAIEFVKATSEPLEEGFVIVDNKNRRVKIKNPAYLSISKAVNAGNQVRPRHFANIVLKGDAEEVISYFDEYKDILLLMKNVIADSIEQVNKLWESNKNAESRKEFAEVVKHHPLSNLLFMAKSGKIENFDNVYDYIKPDFLIKETVRKHEVAYKSAIRKAYESRQQKFFFENI